MLEQWKSLKGLVVNGDNYEVSNLGNIRHVSSNKLRKPAKNNKGYQLVCLYQNNKVKGYLLHRLVALAFIPNIDNKPEVNHLDGNKENNVVTNLEWSTRTDNLRHAIDTGLQDVARGSNAGGAKLTEEIVREIRNLFASGTRTQKQLSEQFGVSRRSVTNIINRTNWKHVE